MRVLKQETRAKKGGLAAGVWTRDNKAGRRQDGKVGKRQNNKVGKRQDNNKVDDLGQDDKTSIKQDNDKVGNLKRHNKKAAGSTART